MTRLTSVTILLATVLFIAAPLVGCHKSSSPTFPSGTTTTSVVIPLNRVTALTISGNTRIPGPNDSSQLTAIATFLDGSTKDVTTLASWFTRNVNIARVSAGLVTGVSLGITTVDVSYSEFAFVRASVDFRVMPEGTYMVSGVVREPPDLPVGGATIQVLDGPSATRSTTTLDAGTFFLPGISSGLITLRVSKEGYLASSRQVAVNGDVSNVAFSLDPATPVADMNGVYRMKFAAAGSCALRPEAKERVYTATVVQQGPRMTITLSDAEFYSSFGRMGNSVSGRVLGPALSLTFGADDYYGIYDVAEIISPTDFLDFAGTAALAQSGGIVAGDFAGRIEVRSKAKSWETLETCAASDHRITMTPVATVSRRHVP